MSLALDVGNCRECSGDEHLAINLRRPNFVTQGDEHHHRGGNQALLIMLIPTFFILFHYQPRFRSDEFIE